MVKQISFMLALFAIALLAVSFASAINVENLSSKYISMNQGDSATFKFSVNNGTENLSSTSISISSSDSNNFATLSSSSVSANANESEEVTVTFKPSHSLSIDNSKSYIYTIKIGSSNTQIVNINVSESVEHIICGDDYNTKNISFDTSDVDDGNDWDDDWTPLDSITVDAEDIGNEADDDYKFDIELLFFNGNEDISSDVVDDTDNLLVEDLKIKEGKTEDASFNFKVSGDSDSDFNVYLKVSNKDAGCYVQKITSISVDAEDGDYSVVSDVDGPVSSSCGENVDLTATISNIGDDDSDRVKVILYNKELGINIYKEIDNLDQGDEALAYFSFIVPQNAVEKNYKFLLYTEFDYDDSDDEYGETSEDDYDYTYSLSLSGNCIDPVKPILSAKLNSSAIVGENLVVAVTFKNNGNTSVSAILAPEDYESWAELLSVEPATITVGRAESKTVYMTFKPSKEGQQTFNLNAIYSGKSIDQLVTVSIEPNTSWMSSLKEQFGTVGAYLIVGIVILVGLIILVLIIKLIVSLVRKH